ncbi:MAG: hypothetical protein LBC46_04210, partial [Treponema sp.]|nr:hypothetical protein [Treponema sp.]
SGAVDNGDTRACPSAVNTEKIIFHKDLFFSILFIFIFIFVILAACFRGLLLFAGFKFDSFSYRRESAFTLAKTRRIGNQRNIQNRRNHNRDYLPRSQDSF